MRAIFLLIPLVAVAGCASTGHRNAIGRDNLLRRAEFDLRCPAGQLYLQPLQQSGELVTAYGVNGCGQQASYILGPKQTFVLDPDTRRVQPAAPPARTRSAPTPAPAPQHAED